MANLSLTALLALTLTACGAPSSASTSTSAPAATATLAGRPSPTLAAQAPAPPNTDPNVASPADIENAFLSNVDDVIAEAADLTVTPCADLTVVTRDNPNLLPSVHGFAAAAKRIGAAQAVLNTDEVKVELADLDNSMGELDNALNRCGIKPP
ncbi:MAG: hypothetical protein ACR2IK_16065 [Chloroflexota bacterium]